jgi:hypothetical protein
MKASEKTFSINTKPKSRLHRQRRGIMGFMNKLKK